MGAARADRTKDLDEGLRLAGYQTTSVAISGAASKVDKRDADLPDTVVSSVTGKFRAQKIGNALERLNEADVPYLHNVEPTVTPTVNSLLNGLGHQNPPTIKAATEEVISALHKSQILWQQDANTFKMAAENPNTNWSNFAHDNPSLVAQTAIHVASVNAGYPTAFVQKMDQNIITNTQMGIPMQAPMLQKIEVRENAGHSVAHELH